MTRENLAPELEKEYRESLLTAIKTGKKILAEGGSALDAVEQTIKLWKTIHSLMQERVRFLLTREGMSLMQQLWMDQILRQELWQELLT